MRRKIANGEIPPEAYYKDQVRERETYISKGLIPPNERRPNNQPIMSRPPLLPNPPMYPQMRPPPSHFYRPHQRPPAFGHRAPGHFHSNYHNRFNQHRNYNPNSYTRHRHPNHSNHYSVAEFIGRQMAIETHKVRGITPLLDSSPMPELSTTDSMPQICTGINIKILFIGQMVTPFNFSISILLIPTGPTSLTFSNPSGISNFNFLAKYNCL